MIFAKPLLIVFGASENALKYALPYLLIYLIGTLPSMISTGMNPFINAQGYSTTGMLSVAIGAVANLEDFTPIYIYSTINIFCSAADINELVEMFKGETGETEEQKEAEYSEKTQDQWETQDEMRSE